MERQIIDQFSDKSHLTSKFIKCFDDKFLLEAAKLASTLSRIGIQLNPCQPFDETVSTDVLKQFQNTLCLLGDTSHMEELYQLQGDRQTIKSFVEKLEGLSVKKQDLELSDDEYRAKQESIENLKRAIKELNRSTKIGDKKNGLEEEFFLNEKIKNEKLKSEIVSLEKELQGFLDFELSTEEDLDRQIQLMDKKYYNLVCSYDNFLDDSHFFK